MNILLYIQYQTTVPPIYSTTRSHTRCQVWHYAQYHACLAHHHAATHATPTTALPILAIAKQDLSFEAHSVQDLEAPVDAELLRDIERAW